jgi:hypothetical protein
MAVVVLLFAVLVATAWFLDARQASRTRDGFAVIEFLVVVTLAALALGAVILAVGAVRSA